MRSHRLPPLFGLQSAGLARHPNLLHHCDTMTNPWALSRSAPLRAARVALIASAPVLGLQACELPDASVPCDLTLAERIDTERTMDNLRVLVEDIGPRVAASPEEREAAEFIAQELESYGYEVEIQEFPRDQVVASAEVLEPAELDFDVAVGRIREVPAQEYPLLRQEPVRGPVVDCGEGGCPDEVQGGIALLTQGEGSPGELVAHAAEAGAEAAILHGDDWRRHRAAVDEEEVTIPFVTVNRDAADAIREAGTVEVELEIELFDTSQNVIATRSVEGNPEAPIVIFSAHYDSVEKSPGASDNGSGTAGMMELARLYADVETDVELRFAAVGSEEVGLVGSRYYVEQLPEEERDRIVANFNTDMIGTAGEDQTQLYVNTLDGDNVVAQAARIARDRLELPEERIRAPYDRGASDHVAFYEAEIPAANFIWRDPETADLEPWYHHPHDRMENIGEDRLRAAVEVVLAASQQLICQEGELRHEIEGRVVEVEAGG